MQNGGTVDLMVYKTEVKMMNKEEAIRFAGLMEEYLHIPAFVCEMIQDQLENNNYKEVVEYVIKRRNEIENKDDNEYPIEEELEEAYKTINQLTNNWNELEEWVKNHLDDEFYWFKFYDKMQTIKNERNKGKEINDKSIK